MNTEYVLEKAGIPLTDIIFYIFNFCLRQYLDVYPQLWGLLSSLWKRNREVTNILNSNTLTELNFVECTYNNKSIK